MNGLDNYQRFVAENESDKLFHVTGVDVYGKRFRIATPNIYHAMGINLYRGSVWRVENGKRTLLRRV